MNPQTPDDSNAKTANPSGEAYLAARLAALRLRAYERQAAAVAEMLNAAGVPQWVEIRHDGDRTPSNSSVERLKWYLARRKDVKPGEIDQDLEREMAEAERATHECGKRHNVKDHSPIGAVGASNTESNSAAPIG